MAAKKTAVERAEVEKAERRVVRVASEYVRSFCPPPGPLQWRLIDACERLHAAKRIARKAAR